MTCALDPVQILGSRAHPWIPCKSLDPVQVLRSRAKKRTCARAAVDKFTAITTNDAKRLILMAEAEDAPETVCIEHLMEHSMERSMEHSIGREEECRS